MSSDLIRSYRNRNDKIINNVNTLRNNAKPCISCIIYKTVSSEYYAYDQHSWPLSNMDIDVFLNLSMNSQVFKLLLKDFHHSIFEAELTR